MTLTDEQARVAAALRYCAGRAAKTTAGDVVMRLAYSGRGTTHAEAEARLVELAELGLAVRDGDGDQWRPVTSEARP